MASYSGGPKTGHKMKLYRNTGSVASPTWVEVAEIGDVSLPDFSIMTAELKRRASNWTKALASIFNLIALEFRLIHGLDSTNFLAIRTNFLAGTAEEWLIANGAVATSGTQGLRLPVLVEGFPWDQPLEDVSGHDVRLVLAYFESAGVEVEPSWMTVA